MSFPDLKRAISAARTFPAMQLSVEQGKSFFVSYRNKWYDKRKEQYRTGQLFD
jgi:hypothetical protein